MIQPPRVGPRTGAVRAATPYTAMPAAAALGGKGIEQDGLRDRLKPAAGNSLDDPPEDQHGQACGQAAEGRGQGEEGHAAHVIALPPEGRGQPARERDDHRVGNQVAGEHPVGVVNAGPQVSGNVRQRHVGDAGIEHFHEGGDRDRQAQ